MRTLTVQCPVCGEDLEFDEGDLAELQPGDVIGCGSCESELEVVDDGGELALEPLAYFTVCPRCAHEFELEDEALLRGGKLECPNCKFRFEPQWEEDESEPSG